MERLDKLQKEAKKENDSQRKIKKYETYKKCRDKIIDLLRVSANRHIIRNISNKIKKL